MIVNRIIERIVKKMSLKKGTIRAFAATLTIGVFLLFFMDVYPGLTKFIASTLAVVQFFPSLVKAVAGTAQAILIFALLILICLVFGRVYCAVLCPLGIFQDIIIFLSRKSGRKKRPSPALAILPGGYPFLWYAVLFLTVFLFISGSLVMVDLFDPFSIFGRFCTLLLVPVGSSINNLMVAVTDTFHPYLLSPVTARAISWPLFFIAYAWLILVTLMAFYHGRLYCNTLCPVGGFFSLLSRVSLFRFSIDKKKCTMCGKCQRICRADCMAPAQGIIDGSRCVACFDCMDVCPEKAIQYLPWGQIPQIVTKPQPQQRRYFLTLVAGGALALPLRGPLARITQKTIDEPVPVIPPGALGIDHFSAICTACLACVSVCPEKVIQPKISNYGLAGIFQPGLDFNKGRCAYTCNACTQVCPSGAILPLFLETKQRTRIGQVVFEKDRCLVYTHKRDCGACAEVCPTHAVHTVKENNIHHPRLLPDACIGCGACQQVCPVAPKAIHVLAVRVHERSGPPFFQKQEGGSPGKIMEGDGEFPF